MDSWKCRSLSLLGRNSSIDHNYYTLSRSQTTSLNITGQRKVFSPSRSSRGSGLVAEYEETKL